MRERGHEGLRRRTGTGPGRRHREHRGPTEGRQPCRDEPPGPKHDLPERCRFSSGIQTQQDERGDPWKLYTGVTGLVIDERNGRTGIRREARGEFEGSGSSLQASTRPGAEIPVGRVERCDPGAPVERSARRRSRRGRIPRHAVADRQQPVRADIRQGPDGSPRHEEHHEEERQAEAGLSERIKGRDSREGEGDLADVNGRRAEVLRSPYRGRRSRRGSRPVSRGRLRYFGDRSR